MQGKGGGRERSPIDGGARAQLTVLVLQIDNKELSRSADVCLIFQPGAPVWLLVQQPHLLLLLPLPLASFPGIKIGYRSYYIDKRRARGRCGNEEIHKVSAAVFSSHVPQKRSYLVYSSQMQAQIYIYRSYIERLLYITRPLTNSSVSADVSGFSSFHRAPYIYIRSLHGASFYLVTRV